MTVFKAALVSFLICFSSISMANQTPDTGVVKDIIKTQDKIIDSQMELIKAQRQLIELVNSKTNKGDKHATGK